MDRGGLCWWKPLFRGHEVIRQCRVPWRGAYKALTALRKASLPHTLSHFSCSLTALIKICLFVYFYSHYSFSTLSINAQQTYVIWQSTEQNLSKRTISCCAIDIFWVWAASDVLLSWWNDPKWLKQSYRVRAHTHTLTKQTNKHTKLETGLNIKQVKRKVKGALTLYRHPSIHLDIKVHFCWSMTDGICLTGHESLVPIKWNKTASRQTS